jgi:hypothetical protein
MINTIANSDITKIAATTVVGVLVVKIVEFILGLAFIAAFIFIIFLLVKWLDKPSKTSKRDELQDWIDKNGGSK